MDQIEELTLRLVDGALSADDEALLDSLCAGDPQALERHLAQLRLEASLRGLGPAPEVVRRTLAQLEQANTEDLERTVMRAIAQLPAPAWTSSDGPVVASPQHSPRWIGFGLVACLAIGLAAAAVVWWSHHAGVGPANVPELAAITERVQLLDAASNASAAALRMAIEPGQTVVAHEDDHALLAYPDGTRVELFGPSQLLVTPDAHGHKRLKLLAGSMHLDVRPQPAGQPLIVATPQGEVRVLGTRFRLATGVERTRIEMEEGHVAFSHHSDGPTVKVAKGAYAVFDETPEDVDIQPLPPTLTAPLWSQTKAGEALAMTASGTLLAVGDRSGSVLLLDSETGEPRAELPAVELAGQPPSKPDRLSFAEQDGLLIGVTERGHVIRWNLADGGREVLDDFGATFALRILSPDGRLLGRTVGGGWQPKVRIWRVPSGGAAELVRDIGYENDIWSAAFSRSGTLVAFGTRIGWVHVEEIDSANQRWRQRMGTENIRQLAISPDERWLAAYSQGLGIQLWSLETSTLAATRLPEGPAARTLVFSPDSQQLAAGLADRTVRFWSIPEGRPTLIIETGKLGASQIAFTPDGRRLATAGQDVALWELP